MFGVFKNSDANIGAAAAKVGSVRIVDDQAGGQKPPA